MDMPMIRGRFESIDLNGVSAPVLEEDAKCFFGKFSRDQSSHKLGIAHPLPPSIGDLPVNLIDVGFRFISAHLNIHQSSSTIVANSEFKTHLDPTLGTFLDEGSMNLGILIFVIDLRAAG
jgi:hypothetical protein